LPTYIQDIIEQHHGNSQVAFFYHKARSLAEDPDSVDPAKYTYHGRIPQSKEAAIVMLCDSVEAGVRALENPTAQQVEERISSIVYGIMNRGMLNDCRLTFKDLSTTIKECMRTLNGMYHERIEYPQEDKKRGIQ